MCIWSLYNKALSRNNEFHSFDYRNHLKILPAESVYTLSAPCITVIHELHSHSYFWRHLYKCWHLSPLPYHSSYNSYYRVYCCSGRGCSVFLSPRLTARGTGYRRSIYDHEDYVLDVCTNRVHIIGAVLSGVHIGGVCIVEAWSGGFGSIVAPATGNYNFVPEKWA